MAEEGGQSGSGVVSDRDLTRAVHRSVLASHLAKRSQQIRVDAFSTLKYIYERARVNNRTAWKQWFRKLAGRCFYAWSDWVYLVGVGLDRKRWSGPRKYEVRYNQKVIDVFTRNRLQRAVFVPWKKYAKRRSEAERRFRKHVARFLSAHYLAWRATAKELRRVRVLAVDHWTSYSTYMVTGPFKRWVEFAENAQTRRVQTNRLVKAYMRWKSRQKLETILRTWRHQSMYGRVEGMYTRTMLSRSLGEQKLLSSSLQKMLSIQTIELEECRDLVSREVEARKNLEQKLLFQEREILTFEMVSDHRDQELRRLNAIIEAMAVINPRQVCVWASQKPSFKKLSQPVNNKKIFVSTLSLVTLPGSTPSRYSSRLQFQASILQPGAPCQ